MKPILIACILLLALTGCGPAVYAAPPGMGGIQGQVLIGPTCPVVRPNDTNCADKPYQATLTVLSSSRQKLTQFTTAADGKFQIDLAPGNYILHPESPNGAVMPHGRELNFSVLAGQYTQLTITYDSGMR